MYLRHEPSATKSEYNFIKIRSNYEFVSIKCWKSGRKKNYFKESKESHRKYKKKTHRLNYLNKNYNWNLFILTGSDILLLEIKYSGNLTTASEMIKELKRW